METTQEYKSYTNHLLVRWMTGESVLYALSGFLLCGCLTHLCVTDGGLYRYTNVDLTQGNVSQMLLVLVMFGNTQLGLLLYNFLALYSGSYDRIRYAISVHMKIALIHLLAIHFFWGYIKSYPLPSGLSEYKPGYWFWHVEFVLSFFYLVMSRFTTFFDEKIKIQ